MNRRPLGIGVLVVSVVLTVAAASSATSTARTDLSTASSTHGSAVNMPARADLSPAPAMPSSHVGSATLLGGPGQVIEPIGGATNVSGSGGQHDSACPNHQPCGP
jgi:hypothetical protein